MRAFENNESKASDELLTIANAVSSNDLLVRLKLCNRKRDANLASIVIHIEKLLAVAVEESDAFDWISLSLSAASLKLSRFLDHTSVDSNADLGQITSWESRWTNLILMEKLDASHANSIGVFEPKSDTLKRLNHVSIFSTRPTEVDVFLSNIRNTPQWHLT